MSRPFTWIASAIFALMALLHLYRLYSHFQVVLGSHVIPMWVSYVAIVVGAGLSWMLCREARGTRGP
jgi:apolipoprotein N-acyltransferase